MTGKLGRVFSVDLAYKSFNRFGFCVLDFWTDSGCGAEFLLHTQLGLSDPPDPVKFASVLYKYCCTSGIQVLLLDGPQGWKDPNDKVGCARKCERMLNTPFKVGFFGEARPGNSIGFVRFSIDVFATLGQLGANLVQDEIVEPTSGSLLAVETFPTSAWRKLELRPLKGKARSNNSDLRMALQALRDKWDIGPTPRDPSHDELQALVSGLAGFGILAEDAGRYIAEGAAPKKSRDGYVEGLIVNPRI